MAGSKETMVPLWRDERFWVALLLGPMVCMLMAAWLPRNAIDYATQWRLLIWLTLIYPVCEEIVFRGGIQTLLLQVSWGRAAGLGISLANLLTSLLFMMLHLVNHSAMWAVLVFVPSLLFGWFRERYGGIFPPILLHCGYNLTYFITFGLLG